MKGQHPENNHYIPQGQIAFDHMKEILNLEILCKLKTAFIKTYSLSSYLTENKTVGILHKIAHLPSLLQFPKNNIFDIL